MRALLQLLALLVCASASVASAGNGRRTLKSGQAAQVAAVSAAAAGTPVPFTCPKKGKVSLKKCTDIYYNCPGKGGKPKAVKCPKGALYVAAKGACGPSTALPECPFLCPKTGSFNATACAKFYYKCTAAASKFSKVSCPRGSRFLPSAKGCLKIDRVKGCKKEGGIGAPIDCPFFLASTCSKCETTPEGSIRCTACQSGQHVPSKLCKETEIDTTSCPYKGDLTCLATGSLPAVDWTGQLKPTKLEVATGAVNPPDVLDLLSLSDLVAWFSKSFDPDLAECFVPALTGFQVLNLEEGLPLETVLGPCKSLPIRSDRSYVFSRLTPADANQTATNPFMTQLFQQLPDLDLCTAVDACLPNLELFLQISQSKNISVTAGKQVFLLEPPSFTFAFSNKGAYLPADVLPASNITNQTTVWTPNLVKQNTGGTFSPVDVAGNIYLNGAFSLLLGNPARASFAMRGTGFSLVNDAIAIPASVLQGSGQCVINFLLNDMIVIPVTVTSPQGVLVAWKGDRWWADFREQQPLLDLLNSVPTIDAVFQGVSSFSLDAMVSLSMYGGPDGGALRLRVTGDIQLNPLVAFYFGINAKYTEVVFILSFKPKAKTFRVTAQLAGRTVLLPFCNNNGDCNPDEETCEDGICLPA